MAMPSRIAFAAVGAATRTLICQPKKMVKHPVTGADLVKSPPVFITFPGGPHYLFLDEQNVRLYGYKDLRSFMAWLNRQADVERGEIIYSAVLNEKLEPVASLGVTGVHEELCRRLMRTGPLDGSAQEKAAALLELRRIAGEAVREPLPVGPVEEAVPAEGEDAKLTDQILGRFSTRA